MNRPPLTNCAIIIHNQRQEAIDNYLMKKTFAAIVEDIPLTITITPISLLPTRRCLAASKGLMALVSGTN